MSLRSYRELVAWQLAAQLGLEVYRVAARLPSSERFGLRSQSQRAAVSVASNIAEGYGRRNRAEYVHFLYIARGSLRELDTHLYFVEQLELVSSADLAAARTLCDRTGAVLGRLIRSLDVPDGKARCTRHPAPRTRQP